MVEPTIVITHQVFPEIIEQMKTYGRILENDTNRKLEDDELIERAGQADALMVFMPDSVDAPFLDHCRKLRIVACALKGCDNIDLEACTVRGIWVSIVPDLLSVPTADLAVALLLALTRNLLEGDRFVRSDHFRGWRPSLYGLGIEGKTAGIVGFGKVGRLIALRLKGFGMHVCCSDSASIDPELLAQWDVRQIVLEELVRTSDCIILATPLLPSTLHLFDTRLLGFAKPGSVLVNVGRGSVVDESAVAEALETGPLAGYAADVFEMEDLSRPERPRTIPAPLLGDISRTVFTPHLGSAVREVRLAIEMAAADNIIDVLEGRTPRNAVNHF